jgi:N-methylhydantoinase A
LHHGRQRARAGVDIGGTFTDVAIEVDGKIQSVKALTDNEEPERPIIEGLKSGAEKTGISLSDIERLIHGTTLATNALIERRGARTAFITTEGFRDVLEMRTESRFDQYDINLVLPPALIDRADRYTLKERMSPAGESLVDPDSAEIAELVKRVLEGGYDSIAIGFLHSYVNNRHEVLVRSTLNERAPNLSVSISSEVSPQIREYERFNTVCANAYVKPLIKSYLDRLQHKLQAIGVTCPVSMMHSGGGIISLESAGAFPVRLVESGPAGGALFAADIARRYGLGSVVSYDMGGTTAKICLIENQVPKTARAFEIARTARFKKGSGMPISIPVVEMVEIGAGGGSLAHVDALQQIRVGPQSAGSTPGPACYDRGGEAPTVTDADLLLGRLDPGNFAGGSIALSASAAERATNAHVATALELENLQAAHGISEVVDESMANAGRVHAIESGKDLANFAMITFGGAGPVHAARLCEKMGIDRFLVPPGAGIGSAIGFLRAPIAFESVRSSPATLDAFDADATRAVLDEMLEEATDVVLEGKNDGAQPIVECTAFMRYRGQGWEIPVAIGEKELDDTTGTRIRKAFESTYTHYFGRPVEGLPAEIISWSIKVSLPLLPSASASLTEDGRIVQAHQRRSIFDIGSEQLVEAAVYERLELAAGSKITGPAVIVEDETSTIIPSTFYATVQSDRCLLVIRTTSR